MDYVKDVLHGGATAALTGRRGHARRGTRSHGNGVLSHPARGNAPRHANGPSSRVHAFDIAKVLRVGDNKPASFLRVWGIACTDLLPAIWMRRFSMPTTPSRRQSPSTQTHEGARCAVRPFERAMVFLYHGQLLGGGPQADRRRLCALPITAASSTAWETPPAHHLRPFQRMRERDLCKRGSNSDSACTSNVADGHVFVNDAPTRERDYLESITGVTHFRGSDYPDLSFLEGRGIVKILYVDWDFDELQELGRKLAPMAERLGVDITFSSSATSNSCPQALTKGRGSRALPICWEFRCPRSSPLVIPQTTSLHDQGGGTGRRRGECHRRRAAVLRCRP